MSPGRFKIILLYSIICFIWGSTWMAIKLGLDGVPPLLGAGVRFMIAGGLILLPLYSQRIPWKIGRRHLSLVAVVGTLNFGLSYGFVYLSEEYISSGLASVLFSVYPFFVLILAHYWYSLEDLNWKKLAGIVLGFLGVVLIYVDEIGPSINPVRGFAAILIATLASSISLVYLKRHGREMNTLLLNFYSMLLGAALLFLGAFLLERSRPIHWTLQNLTALLYLAVFGSVVAFTIYFFLLKHLTATQMSYVTLICPVLALILGSIFLHEQFSRKTIAGAAMVLGGVFISNRAAVFRSAEVVNGKG